MISGSWDRAPSWAQRGARSLLEILSFLQPLPHPTFSLFFKKKATPNCNLTPSALSLCSGGSCRSFCCGRQHIMLTQSSLAPIGRVNSLKSSTVLSQSPASFPQHLLLPTFTYRSTKYTYSSGFAEFAVDLFIYFNDKPMGGNMLSPTLTPEAFIFEF